MKVHIKNVRLCFAHNLFSPSKPRVASADSKEKYQGEFIIERDSEAFNLMIEAINEAAKLEWGEKAPDVLKQVKAAGKLWCLRDGDTKDRPEYQGKMVVSAKNEIAPLLVDEHRKEIAKNSGKLYSGCYVNAIIDVKAGSQPSKQVWAYLLGVQFWADGERLSGASAKADDFDAIPQPEQAKAKTDGAAALF